MEGTRWAGRDYRIADFEISVVKGALSDPALRVEMQANFNRLKQ
jgi:hypothetical protein